MVMKRYSSLRGKPFIEVLTGNLQGAQAYDRIAGYFSSSILDIAGEALESMAGKVRLVCNSQLDVEDVKTAKLAAEAMRQEWNSFQPENLPDCSKRFQRLYEFLATGKLEVRVLPSESFGLEHGKAGVFTRADGSRSSFLGSANATYMGWKGNYELVWEDDADATVTWVQEEFDRLWNHPEAIALSDYVVSDIKRLKDRHVIGSVDEWRNKAANPASATVEAPIYRQNFGLWEHQKYFVDRAFRDHKTCYGARYVLADQVGLGKTVQLAVTAELMALYGDRPILIVVPKTLMEQWQGELKDLMGLPSAIWRNKQWVDENGVEYPLPVSKCPRRMGIISQGIISNGSQACQKLKESLLQQYYECVIVDEAHRARRRNLSEQKLNQKPEMNNLYRFLMQISLRTHSMLLATATPVQMYKVEAYDLLNILSQGSDSVLGRNGSKWLGPAESVLQGLDLITGESKLKEENEIWQWVRNPFPPAEEDVHYFGRLRKRTGMTDGDFVCAKLLSDFEPSDRKRAKDICLKKNFFGMHNPYIRHIIRRERSYLENTVNPETGQTYLPKISVKLVGESAREALALEGYLGNAYACAEIFCQLIQERSPSAGLFKTLLLKRVGSSMIAGLNTGRKILTEWQNTDKLVQMYLASDDENADDNGELEDIGGEFEDNVRGSTSSQQARNNSDGTDSLKNLTQREKEVLEKFVGLLEVALTNEHLDPKYDKVYKILNEGMTLESGVCTKPWKQLGCIIFSQYYDTVEWVARCLSKAMAEPIGVYAGGSKSGIFRQGIWHRQEKTEIKQMVRDRKLKILVGTDAASEGLNLQTLGTLINLDLPWNPTRLEQRKGRIQRIGQMYDTVYVCNLRYKDSVEDRVHQLLSNRMESIYKMFGQLPDVLEDVWVDVAIGNIEEAKKRIDSLPEKHPFEMKYHEQVEHIDWESCAEILRQQDVYQCLVKKW